MSTDPTPESPRPIPKRRLYRALYDLVASGKSELRRRLDALYAPDAAWRGSHPLNELGGVDAIEGLVWKPLMRSFPDLERRDLIFIGGRYQSRDLVAAMGHYCGTFRRDWLGIPATGRPVYLRYGEVHRVEDGRIVQSSCLWDVLDLMRQAGFRPLAPSLGSEGMWPAPITADGVVLSEQDAGESASSIRKVLAMQQALADFDDLDRLDRDSLLTMPQKEHWHRNMMWYGPAGIGTTRGLQGFVDFHQLALPDRLSQPAGRRSVERAPGTESAARRGSLHPDRGRSLRSDRRVALHPCAPQGRGLPRARSHRA